MSLGPCKDKGEVEKKTILKLILQVEKEKYWNYHQQIGAASEDIAAHVSIIHWYLSFYITIIFFMLPSLCCVFGYQAYMVQGWDLYIFFIDI